MPELFFPTAALRPAELCDQQPESLARFLACNPQLSNDQQRLAPYVAYDISGNATPQTQTLLHNINQLPVNQRAK